jgi:uncharacterized protein
VSSPLVVPIADLLRRPGTQRPVEVDAPLDDLALSSARVPSGAMVAVRLVLEATSDASITATGTVRAPYAGECRRCLREVEGVLEAEVQEVFEAGPPGSNTEADTYPLRGEFLDLEPMVRDVVLLGLPLAPLCGAVCSGPDPDGQPVAVEGEDDKPTPAGGDPRWAALRDVKFD